MTRLEFLGACETVTGSKFILTNNKTKILVDCGMYQGHKDSAYIQNKEFVDNIPKVDCCILSHAHIDHSGLLPALTKSTFDGKIYATPATTDLCKHMLLDSAVVYTKELPIISKMLKRNKIHMDVSPLYDMNDAKTCMESFVPIKYKSKTKITDNVSFTFHDSCHILGSASVKISLTDTHITRKVWYTSDIGSGNSILSNTPKSPQNIDYLIIESTYGNKKKRPDEDIPQLLIDYINDANRRGGKVIIPAFSVDRMQSILLMVHKLHLMGLIPNIKIYVDSPLGSKVTNLYKKYSSDLNQETLHYFTDNGINPFEDDMIEYITSMDESRELAISDDPAIIISASGMCEGGHIREHLKYNVGDKSSTVLFVGYNAEGTLGRRLQENNGQVTIDGESYRVRCKVETIHGMSAHADVTNLLAYIENCVASNDIKNIFLVHGEEDSIHTVQRLLKEKGITNVIIPKLGESYPL